MLALPSKCRGYALSQTPPCQANPKASHFILATGIAGVHPNATNHFTHASNCSGLQQEVCSAKK